MTETVQDPHAHAVLKSALDFAVAAHEGQLRKSGELYIEHPIAVGENLWNKFHDVTLTAAGLLHDTVEDNPAITVKVIEEKFGKEIAFLIDANTKTEHGFLHFPEIVIEDKIERLLWASFVDIRSILVKIADRHHNVSTISHLKENRQVRMSFETQAIFYPLVEILDYEHATDVSTMKDRFQGFMKDKCFSSPKELKDHLISQFFKNIDGNAFQSLYENSDKVLWEVAGLEEFKHLCSDPVFEKAIYVDSIITLQNKISVRFKLIRANVPPQNSAGISFYTFVS